MGEVNCSGITSKFLLAEEESVYEAAWTARGEQGRVVYFIWPTRRERNLIKHLTRGGREHERQLTTTRTQNSTSSSSRKNPRRKEKEKNEEEAHEKVAQEIAGWHELN